MHCDWAVKESLNEPIEFVHCDWLVKESLNGPIEFGYYNWLVKEALNEPTDCSDQELFFQNSEKLLIDLNSTTTENLSSFIVSNSQFAVLVENVAR